MTLPAAFDLVTAVRELSQQLDALRAQLAELERRVQLLEKPPRPKEKI